MDDLLGARIKTTFEEMKKQRPLVHHLTNYVTACDSANIALSFGARPIMADAAEEITDITVAADSLVLNLGTMNPVKFASMELAAVRARKKGIPIVVDPVGVMASDMRLNAAMELLRGGVSIVRGNYDECRTLLFEKRIGRGVDSSSEEDLKNAELAAMAAAKYCCVFAVTGRTDAISAGSGAIIGFNGDEMLTRVTGTGCMTTTLIGCAAACTKDYEAAAVLGIQAMNVAAEAAVRSLADGEGTGTFKVRLLDAVYNLSLKTLIEKSRLEKTQAAQRMEVGRETGC